MSMMYEKKRSLCISSRGMSLKLTFSMLFVFLAAVIAIVFASTVFSATGWSRNFSRVNYAKICSLLRAFNLSNHPQSLSPGLHAAAAELVDQNPGKMELLQKAIIHDEQFTPRESRGRSLTAGTFWVILSCNDDPIYAFSIPIVSLAWARIAGARPLVLLVGSGFHSNNAHLTKFMWVDLLLNTLKDLGIDFIVLDSRGISPVTFSQVSRLFGMKLQVWLVFLLDDYGLNYIKLYKLRHYQM